jgi:hypothetical protein
MRSVLQCLAAAFASLAVPVAEALGIRSGSSGPPLVSPNGSIDDAPERAAMVFLILSPALLGFLVIFFAASAAILRHRGKLSLGRLYLLNFAVAVAVATSFAHDSYGTFGARDAAISFGLFGLLTFMSFALGSTAWWLLRPGSSPRS